MREQQLKEYADNKVLQILLNNKEENSGFYGQILEQYNYSANAPISPIYMPNVNDKHNIIITEEAYNDLIKIRQITEQTNCEVAYFLFGEEKSNGAIWLDSVISNYKPSSQRSADFSDINKYLVEYLSTIKNNQSKSKQVVVHGHTHSRSHVNDNFSFDDLSAYIQMANLHPLFKSREVETIGMLLAPHGDFNFIMYENDPEFEGFYTFPSVYVRTNEGYGHLLPAYQNGNYSVKNSLAK